MVTLNAVCVIVCACLKLAGDRLHCPLAMIRPQSNIMWSPSIAPASPKWPTTIIELIQFAVWHNWNQSGIEHENSKKECSSHHYHPLLLLVCGLTIELWFALHLHFTMICMCVCVLLRSRTPNNWRDVCCTLSAVASEETIIAQTSTQWCRGWSTHRHRQTCTWGKRTEEQMRENTMITLTIFPSLQSKCSKHLCVCVRV